jgi:serine/threonine protein kinase
VRHLVSRGRHPPRITQKCNDFYIQDVIRTDRQKFKAIADIAEGLEHLRQKRIAHRDLKL